MPKKNSGFTLIELLVVIGILGLLLAIVLVAINPAKQFAQANNTTRRSNVNALLNSINQYSADNTGKLPTNMPAKGAAAAEIKKAAGGADICSSLTPTYIAQLPTDPSLNTSPITDCTSNYATGYFVLVDVNGRVTASASAESVSGVTPVISVTR